jgi:branched-chain amino acid transport system ATP-binding protein
VFNCITGFYKPSEGMITLTRRDGSPYLLERLPNRRDPGQGQGGPHLPEHPAVLRHDGAGEPAGRPAQQADEGLRLHRARAARLSGYRKASAESIELAKFWLEKADLIDRADDPAGDLPYGAQRRLEIARAMCTGRSCCASTSRRRASTRASRWRSTRCSTTSRTTTGTSILLIEHDMSVVMQISDHVVVLEYGRKISDGDPPS